MLKIIVVTLALLLLVSCNAAVNPKNLEETVSCKVTNVSSGDTTTKPVAKRVALYWENTTSKHDERKPWSDALVSSITKNFETLDKAKDTKTFCPKYSTLTKDQKIKAIAEFFVALAYYESGFNPESNSVDVGTKSDLGSYSVGLYQVSGNDSAAKVFKADYKALKNPITNINVAVEVFRRQVVNTGLFLLDNKDKHRYFATLLYNNKYQVIDKVVTRVKNNAPFCK